MRIRSFAADIASYLDIPLGKAAVGQFSDGESMVEIQENVRGRDVFVVQPTCEPTNDNLMELLVMVDALRWSSVRRVTAVIPYFGYARQDRRPRSARVPITARLAAKMIGAAGADRVLTMDLHADQIQGFFDIPVDNVYASPILLGDVWRQKYDNLMVVSPDVGGVVRARALAKRLDDADLAIIDKRRPKTNVAQVMNIIGDVQGPHLRPGRRPGRYRRHAVQGGGCPEGARRSEGGGLLHARGAVGTGGNQHRFVAAGRIGGDEYHSAARRRGGMQQDSSADDCRPAGRVDPSDQQRGIRQFTVRGLTLCGDCFPLLAAFGHAWSRAPSA